MDQFNRTLTPSSAVRFAVGCGFCGFVSPDSSTHAYHVKTHELRTMWTCFECEWTAVSIADVCSHVCKGDDHASRSAMEAPSDKELVVPTPISAVESQPVKATAVSGATRTDEANEEDAADARLVAVAHSEPTLPTVPATIPVFPSKLPSVCAGASINRLMNNKFQCAGCEEYFESEAAWRNHIGRSPPDTPDGVGAVGSNQHPGPSVNRNESNNFAPMTLRCQRCPSQFSSAGALENDMDTAHAVGVHGSPVQGKAVHATISVDRDEPLVVPKEEPPQPGEQPRAPATDLNPTAAPPSAPALCCHICDDSVHFGTQIDLVRHLSDHGVSVKYTAVDKPSAGVYRCGECGFQDASRSLVSSHRSKMHSLPVFACDKCTSEFLATDHLASHVASVHNGVGPSSSPQVGPTGSAAIRDDCEESAKANEAAEASDGDGVAAAKAFACHVCPRRFTDTVALGTHLKSHDVDVYSPITLRNDCEFVCGACGSVFATRRKAVKHRSAYHKTPTFPCTECGVVYLVKEGLEEHVAREHASVASSGPQQGPSPNEPEVNVYAPATELLTATGKNGRYQCHVCSRSYSEGKELITHLREHDVEVYTAKVVEIRSGWFQCDACGFEAPSRSSVVNHRGGKHKPPTYTCTECGLSYFSKEGLEKHASTKHPGVEVPSELPAPASESANCKFQCHVCKVSYYQVKDLIAHLRSHDVEVYTAKIVETDSGTFRCDQCDFEAPSRPSVVNHRGGKHKPPTFACQHCNVVFLAKAGLDEHRVALHRDESSPLVPSPLGAQVAAASSPPSDLMPMAHASANPVDERSVACPTCGVSCESEKLLQYHVRLTHPRQSVVPIVSRSQAPVNSSGKRQLDVSVDLTDSSESGKRMDKRAKALEETGSQEDNLICDRCKGVFIHRMWFEGHRCAPRDSKGYTDYSDSDDDDSDFAF